MKENEKYLSKQFAELCDYGKLHWGGGGCAATAAAGIATMLCVT